MDRNQENPGQSGPLTRSAARRLERELEEQIEEHPENVDLTGDPTGDEGENAEELASPEDNDLLQIEAEVHVTPEMEPAIAIANDLMEYIRDPTLSVWKEEAERLEEAEDEDSRVHIRRYLIDEVSQGVAKENRKHLSLLLKEASAEPFLTRLSDVWNDNYPSEEAEEDSLSAKIGRAIGQYLATSRRFVQQRTETSPAAENLRQTQHPAGGLTTDTPTVTPRIPRQSPQIARNQQASLIQRPKPVSQQNTNSESRLTNYLQRSRVSNSEPSPSTSNVRPGLTANAAAGSRGTNRVNVPAGAVNAPAGAVQTPASGEPSMQSVLGILEQIANVQLQNSRQCSPRSQLKLPTLEIGTFKGDKLEFIPFWDRFEAVVDNNKNYSDQQKFLYLQQSLTKDAGKFCWGASTDTLTYADAVEKLFKKYCQPRLLIDKYEQMIHDCPAPSSPHDTIGIRNMIDTTERSLSSLRRFGVTPEEVSNGVMRTFRMKMSSELLDQLHLYSSGQMIDELCLTEFLEVLDKYAKVQERTRDFKSLIQGSTSSGSGQLGQPRTTMAGVGNSPKAPPKPAPRTKLPCLFCNAEAGTHSWRNCPKVKNPADRYKKFTTAKRCTACGQRDHHWTNCPSNGKCRVLDLKNVECGRKHHNSLHEYFMDRRSERGNQRPPQQGGSTQGRMEQPPPGTQSGSPSRGHTGCASDTSTIPALIGIVQGDLSPALKPKKAVKGNIYIDDGSNLSYITTKMASHLELPIEGYKEVCINTLDGNTITGTLPQVELRISSKRVGKP